MAINSPYGFWHNFILEKSPSGRPQADIHEKECWRWNITSVAEFIPCIALLARKHKEGNVQLKCGSSMWDLGKEGIQVLLQTSCGCMLSGSHVFLQSRDFKF